MEDKKVTIQTTVKAPIEKVWDCWNNPQHIKGWAFASDTWTAPTASNDLKVGGKFKTRMEAKDKSEGFDFEGTYTAVKDNELIEYDMKKAPNEEKARHVKTEFKKTPDGTEIIQTFDPENENPIEMQRQGWQAILTNFKLYTEKG